MGETAVLEIKRSDTGTTQIIIKVVLSVIMSIALIGYALTVPNPTFGFIAWGLSLISLMVLGIRVMTLFNSRIPLQITPDSVIIGSSAKVTVPRAQITGAGRHPKTDEPCLFFDDPAKGTRGPLRLPLRFIDLDQHTLLGKLVDVVGRAPEAVDP